MNPLLLALYGLAAELGDAGLARGADLYLQRFAWHCTDTPSGLFPWGEHAFWNLADDRPGNSYILNRGATPLTHDHLHQAPKGG